MHNVFMRDRGVLIELKVDGSGVHQHFHNLAHWYGREYIEIIAYNPVNVDEIINRVKDVIIAMDLNKY